MEKIKVALCGVGNCASALIQGIHYDGRDESKRSKMPPISDFGGYDPSDIEVVTAFDIDERKVGKDLAEAIFSPPNCTRIFHSDINLMGVQVEMGKILDGCPAHMAEFPEHLRFKISKEKEATKADVVDKLMDSGAEILVNFLPVGSQKATEFYVECALEAGLALINCVPVFIASDPEWEKRFQAAKLPIIGDDIKSQLGATIIHRALTQLFSDRGVDIDHTYQLNFGGNTDFMNMLDKDRLISKKISKTESVQSILNEPLDSESIHVGPSDYVAWKKDSKTCYIRIEGSIFGDTPIDLELRLNVEDSPNSASMVVDAIRVCKLALSRKCGGALIGPSAYFMKHPPQPLSDAKAKDLLDQFVSDEGIC